MKRALITGITGQDGSYLAELLLEKGYEVHGTMRRVSLQEQEHRVWRIRHILNLIHLHQATLESYPSIFSVVTKVIPDECYHLASQSMVMTSFEDEFSTMHTNIDGTHFMLSALREACPKCRFYFAGSSEMYGDADESPQNERTRFHPRSPYAISKVAGFHMTRFYRERHGMFALSGILFNHESPRRSTEFVTRKITKAVASIAHGKRTKLTLGTIDAQRDWGYSPEYVAAMHRMLQLDHPDDFCIATGETHSVREFVEEAFAAIGIADWRSFTSYDESNLVRPTEVNLLLGDASKANRAIGWKPVVKFKELVGIMVDSDVNPKDYATKQ